MNDARVQASMNGEADFTLFSPFSHVFLMLELNGELAKIPFVAYGGRKVNK